MLAFHQIECQTHYRQQMTASFLKPIGVNVFLCCVRMCQEEAMQNIANLNGRYERDANDLCLQRHRRMACGEGGEVQLRRLYGDCRQSRYLERRVTTSQGNAR